MEEKVRKDIIDVLNKAKKLILKEDSAGLSELSNHTVHNASVFQDDDSIAIAIIIYALSKIVARNIKIVKWKRIKPKILEIINYLEGSLEERKFGKYRNILKDLLKVISDIDKSLKLYIDDVIAKAKIKKGSKLYEHGISISRIAEIFGLTHYELLSYIGKTTIADEFYEAITMEERMKFARSLFR